MEQTATMIEDFIRLEQRKIDNPRGLSQQALSDARVNILELEPLLSDYKEILRQLDASGIGTPRGGGEIPEAARNAPALQSAAEKNGVTVEEIWENLSPEARQRFGGQP